MKKNILIFAGTTEGRQLAEYAVKKGIPCIVSAATEYGEELLENDLQLRKEKHKKSELRVIHGRMDQQEMEAFFEKEQVGLVIDATHPFAVIVTENIQRACKNSGIEYLRCLRDFLTEAKAVRSEKFACERTNAITKSDSSVVCVNSVEEAVDYLEQTQGNILITTGSKELDKYTRLTNYKERCYVRVLSVLPSVMQSIDLGFSGKHLIAMQGPFSREMNLALLHQTEAKYFVTKESGKNGGFAEKLEAAEQAGAVLLVIGRPIEEGLSVEEAEQEMRKWNRD